LLLKVILHVLLFPLLFPSGFWLWCRCAWKHSLCGYIQATPSQHQYLLIFRPSRQLLADEGDKSQDFVNDLRETLLQDPIEPLEEEPLVAEIATQICYELAHSIPSPWHHQGYKTLWALYYTPIGRNCLQALACKGDLVDKSARNAFQT
jgi:hypothetical protein